MRRNISLDHYTNTPHRRFRSFKSRIEPYWRRAVARYEAIIQTRTMKKRRGIPKPAVVAYRRGLKDLVVPASLPTRRKRALSIGSVPQNPTLVDRILPGRIAQRTSKQEQCAFLRRLPAEIRNIIYRYVLGDRVLHIIPGLVPSRSTPSRPMFSWRTPRVLTRLDHEPCKFINGSAPERSNPSYPAGLTAHPKVANQHPHSSCTSWISGAGELYYVEKSEREYYVESRYKKWWRRNNGPLALLKTCRQIYSEAIYILYTTNTFDFRSLDTLTQFISTRTLLPQRVNCIRSLNIRITAQNRSWIDSFTFENHRNLDATFMALPKMRGLHKVELIVENQDTVRRNVDALFDKLNNILPGVIMSMRWL